MSAPCWDAWKRLMADWGSSGRSCRRPSTHRLTCRDVLRNDRIGTALANRSPASPYRASWARRTGHSATSSSEELVPAEVAALAAYCVVNGFVNETRRNYRDGVRLRVMLRPGESA